MTINLVYSPLEKEVARVDVIVAELARDMPELDGITRSRIKRLIAEGKVLIDGNGVTKAGALVEPGSTITLCSLYTELEPSLTPCSIPLSVLYEDNSLLVVDKQAGLTVHPAPGTGNRTLVNAVAARCGLSKELDPESFRPGVVHRLDRDTTGLIVVARTEKARSHLARQFQERSVRKKYTALAAISSRRSPLALEDAGIIDRSITRNSHHRTKMTVCEKGEGGKTAYTEWSVVKRSPHAALVDLVITTGRTHQIRVHLQSISCPIVGDPLYGNSQYLSPYLRKRVTLFGRQALHATELEFTHPESLERLTFNSSPPRDFMTLWDIFLSDKNENR
jgi:23S rRNA pseudouridine1911/1915/1917 synthase